jgi:hypothetical protein
MSAATEIANAEADKVEAELGPDEELDPDGETDEEPEPEPEGESEASIQARIKKISDQVDREDERHVKRYREIFGEEFDSTYKECPLCQLAGWAFPYDGNMPEEQRQVVALVIGEDGGTDYKEAQFSQTCDACDGLGQVLSGAKTPHGQLVVCRKCTGNGWIEKLPAPISLVPPAAPSPPPGVPFAGPDPSLAPDQWGRQQGHPHYGIDPNLVYPTVGS